MHLARQCATGVASGSAEGCTPMTPVLLCGPCEPSTSGRQHQPQLQQRSSTTPRASQHAWGPQTQRCPPAHALVLLTEESHTYTSSPLDEAKLLTAKIKYCKDWRRLQRLLTTHPTAVNHVHVSAVLSRLTVVIPQPGQPQQHCNSELQGFYQELMCFLSVNLHHLSARELSNVLGAMAKLGMQPSYAFLTHMADAAQQQLKWHSGQDCASTAWALARLSYFPSASWLASFVARCKVSLPGMDPQSLSNLLWALASWAHRPPQSFMEAAAGCVSTHLLEFSSQGLSNVLWAFAKLRYKPLPAWMEAYWDAVASHARGSSMHAAELSSIIFAAGKLGSSLPAEASLQLLVGYLNDRMHELDFSGACCAMWGFSMLRFRPQPLMHAWFAHTQSSMDRWTSGDPSARVALPAGRRAKGHPPTSLDCISLSNALYALQQFEAASGARGTVPSAWLQSAVRVSAALIDKMDLRSLAVSGLCLAKLGAAVDSSWLASYASAAQRGLRTMNTAEVANVLCALSRFRYVPSEEFMYLFMRHLHEDMIRFKAKELANSCLALVLLSKSLIAEAEPSCQWGWKAIKMWTQLHAEVKSRWQLLPSSSADTKSVTIMRHALKLAGQDASWLPYVPS